MRRCLVLHSNSHSSNGTPIGKGSLVSVVGALVALRKRVGMMVVEQRVVPITPRKLL